MKGTSQQVPLRENLSALPHLSPATFLPHRSVFPLAVLRGRLRRGPPPEGRVDNAVNHLRAAACVNVPLSLPLNFEPLS